MRELCSNQTNSILHGRLKQRAEHIARTQDIAGIMFLGKNARLKLIIKQKYCHMWRKRHTANSKHNIIERFWSTEEWKAGVLGTNSSIGQRNIEEGQINLLVILFGHLVKKTRHTGDFPRFHFETVHKLFSIRVIPLLSHRPLIVVKIMIPLKMNLSTYYVRQNPSHSAYFSSPPLPSWVVEEKVPVCRLISDCLVSSASSASRPNTNSDWGILKPETRPKMTKEKYPKILTVQFWMQKISTSADCSTLQN